MRRNLMVEARTALLLDSAWMAKIIAIKTLYYKYATKCFNLTTLYFKQLGAVF